MDKITQQKLNKQRIKKDGTLYRFVGSENKLIEIDVLDELIDEKMIKVHLIERDTLKNIVLDILNDNECNYNEDDLESLRSGITDLLVINPNKKYADVKISEEGYIEKCIPITESIIEVSDEIPENIENGCYKVVENQAVLDDKKMKEKILL